MKIRTNKKIKIPFFSELISFVISIYFDYKIEYFYRENSLHVKGGGGEFRP